jgi:signal peptidase II
LVGAETGWLTRGRLVFAAVAVAVFVLDRVSKYLVVTSIPPDTERGPIAGVLWIQHLQNSCAAFSLCGPSQVIFLVVSLVVAVAIVFYELQAEGAGWNHAVLGLVLGGVLGNGYDRLLYGSVTDFLALHWWPTFNVADSAITIGVVALALGYLARRRPDG